MNNGFEAPIFLTQGGNPDDVADALASFVDKATKSLHIAIYAFLLEGSAKTKVVDAIQRAAARGVDVKIAYDHTTSEGTKRKGGPGDDVVPRGTMEFVLRNFQEGPYLKTKPITGCHLMHNKYILRDDRAVWTGSTNFTTSAWGLQENNVLCLHSHELAALYEQDFQELWQRGDIHGTGMNDVASLSIGKVAVKVAFCPCEGTPAASLFVEAIHGAGETIWISSMVLSSAPILGALADHLDVGGKIRGIYDATQMKGIEDYWRNSPQLGLWNAVKFHLIGKHSTPFTETGLHDFMHNKVLVTDRVVLTGSFNLSRNAEHNAENCLSIASTELVGEYKAYIDRLVELYAPKGS